MVSGGAADIHFALRLLLLAVQETQNPTRTIAGRKRPCDGRSGSGDVPAVGKPSVSRRLRGNEMG